MKTNGSGHVIRARFARTLLATSLAGMALAAGAQSFPDFPLQTGTNVVPANILFILDDSGSMAWEYMPDVLPSTPTAEVALRTVSVNPLAYNPSKVYRPWMGATGRLTGGTTLAAAFCDNAMAGGTSTTRNISAAAAANPGAPCTMGTTLFQTFYVLKPGQTSVTNIANFYRYQIRPVTTCQGQGSGSCSTTTRMVRSEWLAVTGSNEGVTNVGCAATSGSAWRNCQFATPTGRSEADEFTNYATWYSWHRTRAKVAKAGASEAFSELGENLRVGYDSIWNRNGSTQQNTGRPAFPIPVDTNGGLFSGTNRTNWYAFLHRANASNGTPLHGALRRAGRYYEESAATGPWGPQTGADQLSCRQSYTILTSDGIWNNDWDYTTDRVGNSDGTAGSLITAVDGRTYTYAPSRPYMDTYEDTLADIAMHYWKRDLRTDLVNNVPVNGQDPAFWQHMVTFGISIGLQGTFNPNTGVGEIAAGTRNWPDPWRTNTNNTASWGNESDRRIDDLLHASVNGRGSFVAATDPDAFARALRDSLASIQRRRASGSNVSSNGPVLRTDSMLFQATYTSGEWTGDLLGLSLGTGSINGDPVWSMSAQATADTRPFSSRTVLTWDGTMGATFPTSTQLASLARSTGPAAVTAADNADYIKGVRTREIRNGGTLRDRASLIGDIVNSSPFYQKATDTLYVGANDGMLHAVNAANGQVRFSYVPGGVNLASLASLSNPEYQHRFFVDGGIDVLDGASTSEPSVLAASLGRGGRGLFGLNVAAPGAATTASVLWDRSGSNAEADMGHVLGAPLVRRGNNGQMLVITGNGIDSPNGKSVLYIYVLNASGGISQVIRLDTGTGTTSNRNGMAEVNGADTNGDGRVDFVYAGDLHGNVWKFDLTSTSPSDWDFAIKQGSNPRQLFVARSATNAVQPITGGLAIAREPGTGRIFVMFGTGRYLSNGDIGSTDPQTVYSLIDSGTQISGRSALTQRTVAAVGTDSTGRVARAWEPYSALTTGTRGWFLDLTNPTSGERVVTAPFIVQRAMWFSSIIPRVGSGCDSGGTGYVNAIDAFTGTNPRFNGRTYGFIDVNGDGRGNDRLTGSPSSGDAGFVGSVDIGIGMPGRVTRVGGKINVCGSDAVCGELPPTPSPEGIGRLSWRELYRRD